MRQHAIRGGRHTAHAMTIRPSIDVATRVSAALSEVLRSMAEDPDRETPPTLDDVRSVLLRRTKAGAREPEFLHPMDQGSALVELDALIEEYGREALASHFIAARASEGLSRVIESALEDPGLPEEPTLGAVRQAMAGGLTARLVGAGAIDEDDDSALLGEIDELIGRYGERVPAETFIRLE
jgi:hypothetical protein